MEKYCKKNKIAFIILPFVFLVTAFVVGKMGALFCLYAVFVFYIVFCYKLDKEEKTIKINKLFLILPVIIFLVARILPFMMHGDHPLGYDTGFYNYNIEQSRLELENGIFLFDKNELSINIEKVESLGLW